MEKEPSDKLEGMQCHDLFFVTVRVITPKERYFTILKLENTMIADSYSVGISAEVLKDSFDTVKWRFAVDPSERHRIKVSSLPSGQAQIFTSTPG
jgi:hypothetical protein